MTTANRHPTAEVKFLSTTVHSAARRHAHFEQKVCKPCSARDCILISSNAARGTHGNPGCLMHPGRHGHGPRTQTPGERPCDKITPQTLLLMLPDAILQWPRSRLQRCSSFTSRRHFPHLKPVLIQQAPGIIESLHQESGGTPHAADLQQEGSRGPSAPARWPCASVRPSSALIWANRSTMPPRS